eukprot:690953-Pelagomonas_calceolata.AAC.4
MALVGSDCCNDCSNACSGDQKGGLSLGSNQGTFDETNKDKKTRELVQLPDKLRLLAAACLVPPYCLCLHYCSIT